MTPVSTHPKCWGTLPRARQAQLADLGDTAGGRITPHTHDPIAEGNELMPKKKWRSSGGSTGFLSPPRQAWQPLVPRPLPREGSQAASPPRAAVLSVCTSGWRSQGRWRDSWRTARGEPRSTGTALHPEQGSCSAVRAERGLAGRGRSKQGGGSAQGGGSPQHSPVRPRSAMLPPGPPGAQWNGAGRWGPPAHTKPLQLCPCPRCCSLTPGAGRLQTANELGPSPALRSRVAPAGEGHPRTAATAWSGSEGTGGAC